MNIKHVFKLSESINIKNRCSLKSDSVLRLMIITWKYDKDNDPTQCNAT